MEKKDFFISKLIDFGLVLLGYILVNFMPGEFRANSEFIVIFLGIFLILPVAFNLYYFHKKYVKLPRWIELILTFFLIPSFFLADRINPFLYFAIFVALKTVVDYYYLYIKE